MTKQDFADYLEQFVGTDIWVMTQTFGANRGYWYNKITKKTDTGIWFKSICATGPYGVPKFRKYDSIEEFLNKDIIFLPFKVYTRERQIVFPLSIMSEEDMEEVAVKCMGE